MASQYVGGWDQSHGATYNSPLTTVQKICSLPGLISYDGFSVNYIDTGLFGVRFITDGNDMEEAINILSVVQRQWKHLSTSIIENDLERSKYQMLTNYLDQLSDNTALAHWLATEVGYFEYLCDNLFA